MSTNQGCQKRVKSLFEGSPGPLRFMLLIVATFSIQLYFVLPQFLIYWSTSFVRWNKDVQISVLLFDWFLLRRFDEPSVAMFWNRFSSSTSSVSAYWPSSLTSSASALSFSFSLKSAPSTEIDEMFQKLMIKQKRWHHSAMTSHRL